MKLAMLPAPVVDFLVGFLPALLLFSILGWWLANRDGGGQ